MQILSNIDRVYEHSECISQMAEDFRPILPNKKERLNVSVYRFRTAVADN